MQKLLETYKITDITTDSRKVKTGSAFFAIKGTGQDGNDYINNAIDNGASLVFVQSLRGGSLEPTRQSNFTLQKTGLPRSQTLARNDERITYVHDIRKSLAEAAAILYPKLPKYILGVTGTNGKTSVVSYAHQLFELLGKKSASIGTLGIDCSDLELKRYFDKDEYKNLTTLDQITLRKVLDRLAASGINYVALEASSHGIDQGRLFGIPMHAAAFTSFSQDHLDYHKTMEHYLAAKLKLFVDNLGAGASLRATSWERGNPAYTTDKVDCRVGAEAPPRNDDNVAIINNQMAEFAQIKGYLLKNNKRILTVGESGDINITKISPDLSGQNIRFSCAGHNYELTTNIIGGFQGYNILMAAGLVMQCGSDLRDIAQYLPRLQAPCGRLERVGVPDDPYQIFVDYAHTPDSLEKSLMELRKIKDPSAGKLKVVFGCGGDRDQSKRKLMGEAAAQWADEVIITDDNPRYEDPGAIRAQILEGAKNAIVIQGRAAAIEEVIAGLNKCDILLIAGKGHEDYQIIAGKKIPFSDIEVAKKARRYT
jgi:UDP-N-acetylmuramoyl-L-alanyl-D-glutamate--2,6-diaminopimelate ligase